jgi:hypothetical protein
MALPVFVNSSFTGTELGTEAAPYRQPGSVPLTNPGTVVYTAKGQNYTSGFLPAADHITIKSYGYGYGTALPKIDVSGQPTGALQRGVDGASGIIGLTIEDLEIMGGPNLQNGALGIYLPAITNNDAGYAINRNIRISRVKVHEILTPVNTASGGTGIWHGGAGLSLTDSEVWGCTNENVYHSGDSATFDNLLLSAPDARAHAIAEGDCMQIFGLYSNVRITNCTMNKSNRNSKQALILNGATAAQTGVYIHGNLFIGTEPEAEIAIDLSTTLKLIFLGDLQSAKVSNNVLLGGAYSAAMWIAADALGSHIVDNYIDGAWRDFGIVNLASNTLIEQNTLINKAIYEAGTKRSTKGIHSSDAAATGVVVRKNYLHGWSNAITQPNAANDMVEYMNSYYHNDVNYRKNDGTVLSVSALSEVNTNRLGLWAGSRRFPNRAGNHVRGVPDFGALVGYQSKFIAEA